MRRCSSILRRLLSADSAPVVGLWCFAARFAVAVVLARLLAGERPSAVWLGVGLGLAVAVCSVAIATGCSCGCCCCWC